MPVLRIYAMLSIVGADTLKYTLWHPPSQHKQGNIQCTQFCAVVIHQQQLMYESLYTTVLKAEVSTNRETKPAHQYVCCLYEITLLSLRFDSVTRMGTTIFGTLECTLRVFVQL